MLLVILEFIFSIDWNLAQGYIAICWLHCRYFFQCLFFGGGFYLRIFKLTEIYYRGIFLFADYDFDIFLVCFPWKFFFLKDLILQYAENKITKNLGLLYKASLFLDRNTLLVNYCSFLHTYGSYAIQLGEVAAWQNSKKLLVDKNIIEWFLRNRKSLIFTS